MKRAALQIYQRLAHTAETYPGIWLSCAVVGTAFLLLLLITPAVGAAGLSSERASGTLELMLSTRLSPLKLVTGKLGSALLYSCVLIVSSIPAMIFPLMYGGVKVTDAVMAALLYVPEAALILSASLLVTARDRSVLRSSVLSYAALLALFALPLFPAFAGRLLSRGGNNYAALALLLCPGYPAAEALMKISGRGSLAGRLFLSFGLGHAGALADHAVPLSVFLHLMLSLLFTLLAAQRVGPEKPRG